MLKILEQNKLKPDEGLQITLTAEELALLIKDLRELEEFRAKKRLTDPKINT